jgi:peroxiredoxin Q/BCP
MEREMKQTSREPRLRIHELVPPFALPSTQGKEVKLWDYKMRKNLVILFYHGEGCSRCKEELKMFAEHYGELVKLEAEMLAISRDGLERSRSLSAELGLPYPLLADPEGRVIEKYTYWRKDTEATLPSVFVTDRYGTLYHQLIADEITGLPDLKEILSWLGFIQSQCPECSI